MNKKYKRNKKDSKIKEIIIFHIKENYISYVIFLGIFIIGVIIGTFCVNNISEGGKEDVTMYINNSINNIKESSLDNFSLLKMSIKNNFLIGIILWFLGSTIIGVFLSAIFVGFKGFCFGYTVSSIIAIYGIPKGSLFLFSFLFLQNLIFIPCIIALCVSGIRLCKSIFNDRKRINVKNEFFKHSVLCCIITVLLMVSSFVEIFISKKLLIFLIKYF